MRIPIKASLTEEISFYLGMIKRQQYLEALDRYRQFLSKYPQKLPIILTNLYKESRKKHDNLQLKVVIAEILYHAELYQDAKYECEEILELSPSFSQAFFI